MSRTCPKCSGKLFITVTDPPVRIDGDRRDLIGVHCDCRVPFHKTSTPMAALSEFYGAAR